MSGFGLQAEILRRSGRATEHWGAGSITVPPNRVDQTLDLMLYRVPYLEEPIPESFITATGNGNTEVRRRGSAINHEFTLLPFDRDGSGSLPPSDLPLEIFVRRETLPPSGQPQLERTLINGEIQTPVIWNDETSPQSARCIFFHGTGAALTEV